MPAVSARKIGAKPGEKHYEELMSQEETRRAMELADYFAIPPAFRGLYQSIDYAYEGETPKPVTQAYSSEHQAVLSTAEIAALLDRFNLFDPPDENAEPADRYWPGDKEELTS